MQLNQNSQRGVSLVESMITLLILSIGLLGIAALQITSMQQNASSFRHSQAVWIGYNMADRIRANFDQFPSYAGIDTSTGYSQDCVSSACNTNQMITSDATDWTTQIQTLPGGRGTVTGDASQLIITVMWDDESTGATGTGCGNNPSVDLTCYTVTLVQ